MGLTAQQIDEFEWDGVTRLGPVLNAEEVAEARTRFDAIFNERVGTTDRGLRNLYADGDTAEKQKTSRQKHFQMFNIWKCDSFFKALLFKENLLDCVESVLGPNIQFFHDQVFYKPARDGGPSHWHQDNAYWRCSPQNMASIWIALDDVDQENSCLYFAPGSHRQPSPRHIEVEDVAYKGLLKLDIDESKAVPFEMPAGHAVMHHCMTIHGAYANRSARPRRALGIHYLQSGILDGNGKPFLNLSENLVLRGDPRAAAGSLT